MPVLNLDDYHRIALNHVAKHDGKIQFTPFDTPQEAVELVSSKYLTIKDDGFFYITEQGKQYLAEHPEHIAYDDPLAGGAIIPAVEKVA